MDHENPNQFRLWNPATKAMEYPQVGCRQFLIGLDGRVFDGNGNPYDENYKILRWSGLKTYLDDLIYEGDIIEFYLGSGFAQTGPYCATVIFYDHGWCFAEVGGQTPQPAYQMDDITVIGNIYEDGRPED
jgi:hypothetical protein